MARTRRVVLLVAGVLVGLGAAYFGRGLLDAERASPGDSSPDGAGRAERTQKYAYFMTVFRRALEEKPSTMREPSTRWRVLVKAPGTSAVRCSTCHAGAYGARMDTAFIKSDAPRPPRPEALAGDRKFMAELMEDWVERLNRKAHDALNKVVVCQDCHDNDPRR